MIGNNKQYKATLSQRDRLRRAHENFDELGAAKAGIDPAIVKAQKEALRQQIRRLDREIDRYESLTGGGLDSLELGTLEDLGVKLVEARLARGITQRELAAGLGLKEQQIQRYEAELYRSAKLSRLVEIANGLGVKLSGTIAIQGSQQKDRRPRLSGDIFDSHKLPAAEMIKRGWIKNDQGRAAHLAAARYIARNPKAFEMRALHRQKTRLGGRFNDHALFAWQTRILELADRLAPRLPQYDASSVPDVRSLVALSREPLGVVRVVEVLRAAGIAVVFERHLNQTHLDGAALMSNGRPVIGLTLRFDRLDNFWFVLMHELGHVLLHYDSGLSSGFFDDYKEEAVDRFEKEADKFASDSLIPAEVWETSLVRFAQSKESVYQFASALNIAPAIIAGRIRKERNDWKIFNDLVGQGEVAHQLVDAGFLEA